MIFITMTIALLVTIALVLVRAILGPTIYDRLLAVKHKNSFIDTRLWLSNWQT